jgi:hypothetical protein
MSAAFHSIGSRHTCAAPARYLITPPGKNGSLPFTASGHEQSSKQGIAEPQNSSAPPRTVFAQPLHAELQEEPQAVIHSGAA